MVRPAPLLLVALIGCDREGLPGLPVLFSDPARVDLAVDSPDEAPPDAKVTIANVGDAPTTLVGVTLLGDHADLLTVDAPIGAVLAPGAVATVHLSVVGAVDPADTPFLEELELTAFGEAAPDGEGDGEAPSAVTIVGIGTLAACDVDADGFMSPTCGGDDCQDEDAEVRPDQIESCNGVDDDCDGGVDVDAIDALAWYPDADQDGYPGFEGVVLSCERPAGYFESASDCDDQAIDVNPSGVEICDGVDQDCDGTPDDDATDAIRFYGDADGDGHGGSRDTVLACTVPDGFTYAPDDCDDQDATAYPGAPETCDRADDDCDGAIDEDAVDALSVYVDQDRDKHGNPALVVEACALQPGLSAQGDDCNDAVATVFPGALESCNGVDDDCNGLVDDGAPSITYYVDSDRDSYGTSSSIIACVPPAGYATKSGDCNDADIKVNPGARETCDGRDEDCNGAIDDGLAASWYADKDGDKYGDPATPSLNCLPLPGYVRDSTDCNDADKTVFPGAVETCDGRDQDCDGKIDDNPVDGKTFYADADGDKFGNGSVSRIACSRPAGYVPDNTDCNDADAGVYPGATEICDGRDQDCDSLVDDGATGGVTWYRDLDKDTYGNDLDEIVSCVQPTGYIARGGDCDDRAPTINPNGKEVCNGRDDDCDGVGDDGNVCPCPTFSFATSTYMICDRVQVPAVAALALCQASGYATSDIDSPEEDAFLDAAVDSISTTHSFFIGLNDLDTEGQHEWYSGLPVSYTDWAVGQPNDPSGNEDCVVIDRQRTWSDTSCFTFASFICEQN
jgi:hypothetical protein